MQQFPATRLRRSRAQNFSRLLLQETILLSQHLIQPYFIVEGNNIKQDIKTMPGIHRLSIDLLLEEAKIAHDLGIQAIAIFPAIDPKFKTNDGKAALDPNGLIPKAIIALKKHIPSLGVIVDIALDPYTNHGHDGVLDPNGYCNNDQTVAMLKKQALIYAKAGADIVAPSDMMDGRIKGIRETLEENDFHNVQILSYAAKYSSCFYGPFRDAVCANKLGGIGNKDQYQMQPSNTNEAMREIGLDIQEGADAVMIKPGMPYLDIVHRATTEFNIPIFVYQVSGEYSMLKLAIEQGLLNHDKAIIESLLCMRRAGACCILTYFATDAARILAKK